MINTETKVKLVLGIYLVLFFVVLAWMMFATGRMIEMEDDICRLDPKCNGVNTPPPDACTPLEQQHDTREFDDYKRVEWKGG